MLSSFLRSKQSKILNDIKLIIKIFLNFFNNLINF